MNKLKWYVLNILWKFGVRCFSIACKRAPSIIATGLLKFEASWTLKRCVKLIRR